MARPIDPVMRSYDLAAMLAIESLLLTLRARRELAGLALMRPMPSDVAQPAARRDESQVEPTPWKQLFERELGLIAAVEQVDAVPLVSENAAVPNVGVNAAGLQINAQWMDRVDALVSRGSATRRRELVRGIAAHEWSHCRDRADDDASVPSVCDQACHHDRELRADETAGRLLATLDSSPEPLLDLLALGPAGASDTHPAQHERRNAVRQGVEAGQAACSSCAECCSSHESTTSEASNPSDRITEPAYANADSATPAAAVASGV